MNTLDWSNLLNHKLILLYIIHKLPGKFTRTSLVNFVLTNGLMNYFLVNQYSLDLIDTGLVDEKEGRLFASSQGDQAFHFFVESLSEDTIQNLDRLLARAKEEVAKKEALKTRLEALAPDDFRIHLALFDQGQDLMQVSLRVSSEAEGRQMIEAFEEDPAGVYKALFASLSAK